jgi:hypothetical protein
MNSTELKTKTLKKLLNIPTEPTAIPKKIRLSANTLICNGCGKSHKEVQTLIKLCHKTQFLICNECIELCNQIVKTPQKFIA